MDYKKILAAAISAGMIVTTTVVPTIAAGGNMGTLISRAAAAEIKVISAVKETIKENRSDIQNYKVIAVQAKEAEEQKIAEEQAAAAMAYAKQVEAEAMKKAEEETAKKKAAEAKKKTEEEAAGLAAEQAASDQISQEEQQTTAWDPIAAEAVDAYVEAPAYVEPVYEEPVYEEPVYEEPVYEEPVYEEVITTEAQPVYDEAVSTETDSAAYVAEETYTEETTVDTGYEEEVYTEDTYSDDASVEETYVEAYDTAAYDYDRADLTADEMDLLAAIIYCEAGGESYEGQVAVGSVVLNRMDSSLYPDELSDVIYQSGQFEPAFTGRLAEVLASGAPDYCYDSAQAALDGENPVGDCLYFHAGGGGTITIGNQTFY